jgi:catechol 2,3-dioxygenase-like lactoylglutathione lyase family enzyme
MTTVLPVIGLHHAKIPVSDLARSRGWFESLLGLQIEIEFRDDDGTIRGVAYRPVSGFRIALREDPARATALAGWDPLALAVPTRRDLDTIAAELDARGIHHGPVIQATLGWLLTVEGPDGVQLRFYTEEQHH